MEPLDRISPSAQATDKLVQSLAAAARESFSGKLAAATRFGSRGIKPSLRLSHYAVLERNTDVKILSAVHKDKDSLKKNSCSESPEAMHSTSLNLVSTSTLNVAIGSTQRNKSPKSPAGFLGLESIQKVQSPEQVSPKKFFSTGDFRIWPERDTLQNVQRSDYQQHQPFTASAKGFFIRRHPHHKLNAKSDESSKQEIGRHKYEEETSCVDSSTNMNSFCDTPTSVSRSSPKSPALPVRQKSKFGILTPKQFKEPQIWSPPIFADKEQTTDKQHFKVAEPNDKKFRIKSCLKSATPQKADCLAMSALRALRSLSCEQPNKDKDRKSIQTEQNESSQTKPKKQVQFCRSAVVYFLNDKSSDAKSAFVATL